MFFSSKQAARAALAAIEVDLSPPPVPRAKVGLIARLLGKGKPAPPAPRQAETMGTLGDGRIEQLLELARSGARLVPTDNHGVRTRLGGLPLLAVGVDWPTGPQPLEAEEDRSRTPLPFVGQFDFAELNPSGQIPEFPTKGLLSLFYDPLAATTDADGNCLECPHIIWEPEPESLQLAPECPPGLATQEGGTHPPRPLIAEHGVFLPDGDDGDYGRLQLADPFDLEYSEWQADVAHTTLTLDHRLGGRANTIQFDGQRQDAETGDRTLPLLQIDSDPESGMCWGDGGRLYLWIWPRDLAAARLDRAVLDFQSS